MPGPRSELKPALPNRTPVIGANASGSQSDCTGPVLTVVGNANGFRERVVRTQLKALSEPAADASLQGIVLAAADRREYFGGGGSSAELREQWTARLSTAQNLTGVAIDESELLHLA